MGKMGFPEKICYTALTYFRRFFFKNCALEFNPMNMCIVCIVVAAKVEEKNIDVKEFFNVHFHNEQQDQKTFPRLTFDLIKKCEIELCKDLNYELLVHKALSSLTHIEHLF